MLKVRNYPADKQRCLDAYFDKLVKMGFPNVCPEHHDKLHLTGYQRNSGPKIQTTIDLRPVNAATKAEQWLSPKIKTKLRDILGSKHLFISRLFLRKVAMYF